MSPPANQWIRFTIGSELKEAILVGQAVHAVCRHLNVDEESIFAIELCVVEGLTNAIRHSYQMRPGHEVTVLLSAARDRVEVIVEDSGTPMPQEEIGRLLHGPKVFDFDERGIEELPEGGMGLQIIRASMDEVAYTTTGTANRLRMVRNSARPEESEQNL